MTGPTKGPSKARKTTVRASRARFEILNAFVDQSMSGLSRSEIAVWMILFRDSREGIAKTSLADMAKRAGVDRRTASRAVGSLAKRRMLRVVRKGGLNLGCSTYAVFPFPMK